MRITAITLQSKKKKGRKNDETCYRWTVNAQASTCQYSMPFSYVLLSRSKLDVHAPLQVAQKKKRKKQGKQQLWSIFSIHFLFIYLYICIFCALCVGCSHSGTTTSLQLYILALYKRIGVAAMFCRSPGVRVSVCVCVALFVFSFINVSWSFDFYVLNKTKGPETREIPNYPR